MSRTVIVGVPARVLGTRPRDWDTRSEAGMDPSEEFPSLSVGLMGAMGTDGY
jgi:hypothetical protein